MGKENPIEHKKNSSTKANYIEERMEYNYIVKEWALHGKAQWGSIDFSISIINYLLIKQIIMHRYTDLINL